MAKTNYPKARPAPTRAAKSTTTVAEKDFQEAKSTRRVKDAESARSIYDRFVTDNDLRSKTIAHTRNQLEGGRPRDPAILEQNGEAWSCNVNFGDAQAARDRTLLPYWKMVNDVPNRAVFTIDSRAPQSEKWQMAFAEAFDEFHEDWASDYFIQFMNFASNFVNYGPGMGQFPDSDTARWQAVNVQRVYFPKNAKMSPDTWQVVALVRDMEVTEMYGHIRDRSNQRRSEYAGWKTNALKAAIVGAVKGEPMPDYRDYTIISDQLVNNDIAASTPFSPVPTVWLYVKGFDGKIACMVFTVTDGVDDFLFEDEDAAESFRHILPAVWYNTGTDAMVHSIKGFGIKNYFFSQLKNRLKSRLMDSATFSLGINFQYEDNNTPDETPPVENYGAFNVFPSGLKQMAVYPQIQAASGVVGMLDQNESENNALYKEQNQQIANSDTATQAKILAAMQGEISVASASIFLSQMGENFYTEQVRRLRRKGNRDADAVEFVRRLKERGVPDEVIHNTKIRVKTGANAGTANPATRAQNFTEGLVLARYPGMNTRWFLSNIIANKYGSNAVDKAMLPEGAESEPVQRRQAQMENTDFGSGVMLQVAPEDAHYEHLQEHLKPSAGIVAAFRKTGTITPEQAAALAITIEHAGQHMTYLQQDETMKEQFQQTAPEFRLIQSVARGILTRMNSQQGPSPLAMTG